MLGVNVLAATSSSGGGFSGTTLLIIIVVIAAFYFLILRPQQRRRQQASTQQNTVVPGARVRTTAGMYATVVDVDGDDVILEIAPGIEARYMKRAIMDVISGPETDEAVDDVEYDETEPQDYAEAEDGDAEDTDDVDDTAFSDGTVPAADADTEISPEAEEAAYEQATGTKKD